MQHIKLVRHGAFLAYWQDLEPTETLRSLDNLYEIVPLFSGQRTFQIDIKAQKLCFRLNVFLLFISISIFRCAQCLSAL